MLSRERARFSRSVCHLRHPAVAVIDPDYLPRAVRSEFAIDIYKLCDYRGVWIRGAHDLWTTIAIQVLKRRDDARELSVATFYRRVKRERNSIRRRYRPRGLVPHAISGHEKPASRVAWQAGRFTRPAKEYVIANSIPCDIPELR